MGEKRSEQNSVCVLSLSFFEVTSKSVLLCKQVWFLSLSLQSNAIFFLWNFYCFYCDSFYPCSFCLSLKKEGNCETDNIKKTHTLKSIKMYSARNNNKNCEILFPEKKKISESTMHTRILGYLGKKFYSK